jgi:hypothetical protein
MSIASEITRLQNDSAAIAAAIAAKGVTVPSGSGYDDYATLIASIQTGGGGSSILPTGYTQKDWIHGNGDAYINTGISGACSWILRVQVDSGTGSAIISHGTTTGMFFLVNSQSKLGYSTDSGQNVSTPSAFSKVDLLLNWPTTVTSGSVSGSYITRSGNVTRSGNFLLLTRSSSHTPIKAKIWRAECYKNGACVFNGIPCTRDSDSKSGLYDTVSGTFFTSSGSNDFTAGDD